MSERDLDYYLNYIYNNIDNLDYNKLIIIYNNLLFLFDENEKLLILKDIIKKKNNKCKCSEKAPIREVNNIKICNLCDLEI